MNESMDPACIIVLLSFISLMGLTAVIFYIKYDVLCLRGLAKDFQQVILRGKEMPEDQRGRMDFLLNLVRESGNRSLIIAWEDYYREYSVIMHRELIPDVNMYINEQRLIDIPCARNFMKQTWQALFILGLAGSLLYLALVLWGLPGGGTGEEIIRSVGISLFSLTLVSLILFVFKLADASCLEKARRSLWEFQYLVKGWLNPVSEATMIGVLVDSQRQHSQTFQEAVGQLEQRLDSFETKALAPVLGRMFQEAVENKLAPVLKETSDGLIKLAGSVVQEQETGMRELAQSFMEKLTELTADRLNGFVQTAEGASHALNDVVSKMEQIQETLEKSKEAQEIFSQDTRASLAEAWKVHNEISGALQASLASVQQAERIAGEMRAVSVSGLEKADAMAFQSLSLQQENIKQMADLQQGLREMTQTTQQILESSIAQVSSELTQAVTAYAGLGERMEASREKYSAELDTRINKLARKLDNQLMEYGDRVSLSSRDTAERLQAMMKHILDSQAKTVDKLAATATEVALESGKIMEKTSLQANELYNGLAGRMDHSIDALGENLAAAMKMAMADSAEIVEKLSVKTEAIKELYDSYFTRVEEQSTKVLDEMDFNVQRIFAAFTNETSEIISRLSDQSSNALEFFDTGIKDLVENLEDQSRSIGLYAKEINMDVVELSGNLRNSVQEFSAQIEGGITKTFENFDEGLGEVTLRLATILDSIRDSAEALQKAFRK